MPGSWRKKTRTARQRSAFVASVVSALLLAGACGGPERSVIEQFFAASRLRDRTALQQIATVVFEPRERGIVTKFEIVRVDVRADAPRERKDVTITAPVALPGGQTVQKTMVVSMQRDDSGAWLVTAVSDRESRP